MLCGTDTTVSFDAFLPLPLPLPPTLSCTHDESSRSRIQAAATSYSSFPTPAFRNLSLTCTPTEYNTIHRHVERLCTWTHPCFHCFPSRTTFPYIVQNRLRSVPITRMTVIINIKRPCRGQGTQSGFHTPYEGKVPNGLYTKMRYWVTWVIGLAFHSLRV